ncbi:hypothetical protein AVEN_754-1 [Araneus ventricosus]|uniref:C2H2-type domain-containing protein n=1 Tax=Araneus ventricosus TaxID=182803 RepID=A0A4Y2TI79_ARAVE|nr:hypothetical protein AVEN_754-1 [Araneus ventricosus]
MQTKDKPHSCDVCGRKFSRKNSLNLHYLTHTKEKPHSCEVCGKAFSLKKILNRHYLTHTKEKPHSCEITSQSKFDVTLDLFASRIAAEFIIFMEFFSLFLGVDQLASSRLQLY